MEKFQTTIDIIGVNPFVYLPPKTLQCVFEQAQKDKGPIPVRGTINGKPFIQTLVKYSGDWRLYINIPMLKVSGTKVGDAVLIALEYDPEPRTIPMHPALAKALEEHPSELALFNSLSPSRQIEIVRYIHRLKSEESRTLNIARAIRFLQGTERFVGRDKP